MDSCEIASNRMDVYLDIVGIYDHVYYQEVEVPQKVLIEEVEILDMEDIDHADHPNRISVNVVVHLEHVGTKTYD